MCCIPRQSRRGRHFLYIYYNDLLSLTKLVYFFTILLPLLKLTMLLVDDYFIYSSWINTKLLVLCKFVKYLAVFQCFEVCEREREREWEMMMMMNSIPLQILSLLKVIISGMMVDEFKVYHPRNNLHFLFNTETRWCKNKV